MNGVDLAESHAPAPAADAVDLPQGHHEAGEVFAGPPDQDQIEGDQA